MFFFTTIEFHAQISLFKEIFESDRFSSLPSYREGRIQLAKMERIMDALSKKVSSRRGSSCQQSQLLQPTSSGRVQQPSSVD
jgi:hypothetical protein